MNTIFQPQALRWLSLATGLLLIPPALAETSAVCMSQVIAPALYQPATEIVTVHENSTAYTTTPVKIGHGERKVKVADAYLDYEIIPAKFGEVTEMVEVERERVEIETLPATYRTETKRIKIKDATTRWNPDCPAVASASQTDIPAHCLLEVPAEYTEITREVVDLPARTVKKIIPAKTVTVTRKILLEPAQVVRKEIPAVYETIKLTRVDEPAKLVTSRTEARTQNLPIHKKVRPERVLQMPALCEDHLLQEDIVQLQQRLQQHGYYQGATDGELGSITRTALTRYQEDNQLASGAITLETLQKLQLR